MRCIDQRRKAIVLEKGKVLSLVRKSGKKRKTKPGGGGGNCNSDIPKVAKWVEHLVPGRPCSVAPFSMLLSQGSFLCHDTAIGKTHHGKNSAKNHTWAGRFSQVFGKVLCKRKRDDFRKKIT